MYNGYMSDKQDYVSEETSREAKIRAAQLGITKIKLYSLVAKIPFEELQKLVRKYLTDIHS